MEDIVGTVQVGSEEFEIRTPKVSHLLRLAKFLTNKLLAARKTLEFELGLAAEKDSVVFLLMALISNLEEGELVDLALLLLQTEKKADKKLVAEELNLAWLSEALALWVEGTQLGLVITNFYRAFDGIAAGMPKELLATMKEATGSSKAPSGS